MSVRPRRALAGLVLAAAALAALPASALAANESLSVTPANTQAGGGTSVTETLAFAPNPQTAVLSLAPGLLSNVNANLSCLVGSPQLTSSCQIGTETLQTNVGALQGNLYLVPPQGTDLAGIEGVWPASGVQQYSGVTLNPSAPGGLNVTTTSVPIAPGLQITGSTANFTTLNGQPFMRLPSSCAAATSTMSVTYASGAGSASGSFTPTGCAALPYAPTIAASITKDATDSGAALDIAITQAANESASKSIVVNTPKGLSPSFTADAACLTASPCQIGTATATSPLVPSAALANGTVTLGGSIASPTLTIAFPAPFAITLKGDVNLSTGAVTFASVPDVPLTSLTLHITGPSGQKAFTTDCVPANVGGTFTAQSGATHTTSSAIAFGNCPVSPTVVRSVRGLASGHPKLKFTVTRGKGAPAVATVAVGVPAGLGFAHSAFVSHRTCTTKGTKKCTRTTLIKGLGIAGAKAKTVALKHGRLVITLNKPASSVTITVSGPLVAESKALQTRVKKHRATSLRFTLKITDAKGTATTVSVTVKPR